MNTLFPRPPGDWVNKAACKRTNPNVFHTPDDAAIAHALTYCARCPVKAQCLDYALELGHKALGVWGGMTRSERDNEQYERALRARRRAS